jgi:hypothetical protein
MSANITHTLVSLIISRTIHSIHNYVYRKFRGVINTAGCKGEVTNTFQKRLEKNEFPHYREIGFRVSTFPAFYGTSEGLVPIPKRETLTTPELSAE